MLELGCGSARVVSGLPASRYDAPAMLPAGSIAGASYHKL